MWTEVILAGFACHFIFHLVSDAVIFDRPRGWLIEKGWWFYVLSCPYCLIAWLALASVAIYELPILAWGAIWWIGVTAHFAQKAIAERAYS